MVHVSGPSLDQLDERGDRFAADIKRTIASIVNEVTPLVKSIDDLAIIRTHWTKAVEASLSEHLLNAWLDSADDTYSRLVKAAQRVSQKQPEQLVAAIQWLQPDRPMMLTAAFLVPKVVSRLAELFLESAINRLVAIGDLVWNTARTQMLVGMQAGQSIVDIRDRIMETTTIAAPRAEVIARTEVIGASNAGSYAEMKATGLNATKEWIATEDSRTRPSHEHVDGQEVDIDEKFIVGGYAMAYPHDPAGPPQETISCRCTLGWDIPEEEFLTINGQPLAASGAEAFHLPGLHNQKDHGHQGPNISKNVKIGKKLKITHGLVHSKHEDNTIIAVTKDGNKVAVWEASKYHLAEKDDKGDWVTQKTAIKSKAYKEINAFADDWHEPVAGNSDANPPITSAKSPVTAPKPTAGVPNKTVKAAEAGKYGLSAGKRIDVDQEMIDKNYPTDTIIAVTPDAKKKMTWYGTFYSINSKNQYGTWEHGKKLSKSDALAEMNKTSADWHEPVSGKPEPVTSKVTPPAPVAPPVTTPTPVTATPKTFTPVQKAYAQSIFGSNGVKWHSDTKKIYDSALEVSQKDPSLTMADALAIMDQSLQKKTGDPFQTKMTKFLKTKAGMNYAQEKGGSAPVGSMKSTTVAAPSVTSSSVPIPKSNAPAKNLTKPASTVMQAEMDKATPPPWTQAQRSALTKYTGSSYTTINKCARGTGPCTPATLATINSIKAAMKPSTQNVKLYRKTNLSTFGVSTVQELEALAGKTIRDNGVVSTSITEGTWSGQVHLKIEAPAGSKMAWVQPISQHPGENEFVLAPGTDFEVISVTPHFSQPSARVMTVRIVPGSGTP